MQRATPAALYRATQLVRRSQRVATAARSHPQAATTPPPAPSDSQCSCCPATPLAVERTLSSASLAYPYSSRPSTCSPLLHHPRKCPGTTHPGRWPHAAPQQQHRHAANASLIHNHSPGFGPTDLSAHRPRHPGATPYCMEQHSDPKGRRIPLDAERWHPRLSQRDEHAAFPRSI